MERSSAQKSMIMGMGKVDIWQTFDGGKKLKEAKYDTDFNGTKDRWDYFVNGSLEKVGFDTNSDQKPDQWQFFNKENVLIRVENDTNFDGDVDRWETFDSSGKLTRIESDRNFDGKPDLVQNK